MLFNSIQFAIFLTITFFIYWSLPNKFRWIAILLANIYFYLSFDVKYLLILFINILISYIFGLIIEKNRKKTILIISIILCLLSLLICKYLNFSIQVLNDIGIYFSKSSLNILLPIGISFYTFEIISYLVDVYKGKMDAEKHLGYYAAYVSFFPTISSGPIEKASSLIPQFKKEKTFKYENAVNGLKLIAWGLFNKIVIADNLACIVDNVYGHLYEYSGFVLLLTIVFYSIQIYCDFSGYSNMARGVSRLFGIDIIENFKSPYLATSIRDFWSRWHISLTKWLTEYIYIPLGGNRKGVIKKYINILIVFFISGLWHGANYTFIIWGLIHALIQIIENVFNISPAKQKNLLYWLRTLITFVIVTIAWIFFRADTVKDALYIIFNMFDEICDLKSYIVTGLYSFDVKPILLIISLIVCLIPLFVIDNIKLTNDVISVINRKNIIFRYSLYILLILVVLLLHYVGEVNFIYFKF